MKFRTRLLAIIGGGFLLIFLLVFSQKKIESFILAKISQNSSWQATVIDLKALEQRYENYPRKKEGIADPAIEATEVFSIRIGEDGSRKVLYEKNAEERHPIASLTKIMTALVALDYVDLNQKVTFSAKAAGQIGEPNFFKEGEVFYARDLLSSALIESSNRAAFALAETIGEGVFVGLMNERAQALGMNNTIFFNPTGLDPSRSDLSPNLSTAKDIALLVEEFLTRDSLRHYSAVSQKEIEQAGVGFHHLMVNTNELLLEFPGVIMGKTGQTRKAGRCLVLAVEKPGKEGYIINIILGSFNHFDEMRKLARWIEESYQW